MEKTLQQKDAEWEAAMGHKYWCNCLRRWRGRTIVTRRQCTCGTASMTHEKAVAQAEAEIGAISAETQSAIVTRVKQLISGER